MKLKYLSTLAATLLLATASSCSDNDWEPGPDVDPDCMSVYFAPLSSYDMIIEPDDSRMIPITIGRAKFDEAATIQLIVNELPEGAYIPTSIDFAAGQQAATVYLDIENMASKSTGTVQLAIPAEMTSPYAAGNPTLTLNLNVAGAWIPLTDDAQEWFRNGQTDIYPVADAKIYVLDGTYNFKIANFLNSGVDFLFTVETPGTGQLTVAPTRNFIDVKEVWDVDYDGWLFFDDANDTYPEWSPDGTYPDIVSLEFDPNYAWINVADGNIYLSPYVTFSDSSAGYYDIWYTFTPLFNPFEE